MHIQSIPMCMILPPDPFRYLHKLKKATPGAGTSNNYAYLVVDEKTKDAVIIDPANPEE